VNEIRDVIDRVGASFDSGGASLENLNRRRNRIRARKRIRAGGLALLIAGCGSLLAARAFLVSSPEPITSVSVAATGQESGTTATTAETTCPTPSGDSPPPVVFSSVSGPVGSSVEVTGTFQTHFAFLQLWWNADENKVPAHVAPPPWPPTGPDIGFKPAASGPVVELASVAGPGSTGDCVFKTTITVPPVEPGTYDVLWTFGADSASPGYSLFTGVLAFEVTG
jgi:hypothetical protein